VKKFAIEEQLSLLKSRCRETEIFRKKLVIPVLVKLRKSKRNHQRATLKEIKKLAKSMDWINYRVDGLENFRMGIYACIVYWLWWRIHAPSSFH